MQDLRLAFRLLWKDQAFTITAVVTLAVCIGANTALFAVVDHVLLRPLRVPESDRVLLAYNSYPKAGADHAGAAAPDYFDRLRDMTAFEEQALFNVRDPSLDLNGTPERLHAMQVTPSFFRLTRVPPRIGRGFTNEEGEVGKNHAVILSDALWQRLFGGRDALGRDVRIDGERHTVVGVMSADFVFIDSRVQAWLPLAITDAQKRQRHSNNWAYLGRLESGATLAKAQAQIDAITAANRERFPETRSLLDNVGFHVVAVRLQDDLVRDVRSTLYLLWGGALFVLLIGCVNVASLVLVRSRARLKELATRMALGAGRLRIVRQLVTEHLLLTMLSAIGGLLIGYAALQLLGTLNIEELPRGTEIRIDAAIVFSTLGVAALIGLLLGAIPVFGGLPTADLNRILREEGRSGTSGRGARSMRRALVVTQVAVAFVLLIGAGLLFASFRRVLAVDPGFRPDGVLTASINLPRARYAADGSIVRVTGEALGALRSIPGVEAAGATTSIPFAEGFNASVIFAEGYQMQPGESLIAPYQSAVTTGYFEAMRVRLVSGRFFDDRDTPDAPRTIIVDQRLANRFWPGGNPVGRRMYTPSDGSNPTAITKDTRWFTVVGVVGEVKLRSLVEGVGDVGAYYFPQAQAAARGLTFVVRTAGAPSAIASAVRGEIARLDRELPVFDVQTMSERMDRSLVARRSSMLLSVAFGFVALFLSALGIYGVLAYLVTQRTKEIGIRIALGSSASGIFQLVLREGLLLVASGFALGAAGVAALGRSLESQLFGVRATDPLVLSLAIATLAVAAFAACALPARRATRIDPIVALAE